MSSSDAADFIPTTPPDTPPHRIRDGSIVCDGTGHARITAGAAAHEVGWEIINCAKRCDCPPMTAPPDDAPNDAPPIPVKNNSVLCQGNTHVRLNCRPAPWRWEISHEDCNCRDNPQRCKSYNDDEYEDYESCAVRKRKARRTQPIRKAVVDDEIICVRSRTGAYVGHYIVRTEDDDDGANLYAVKEPCDCDDS